MTSTFDKMATSTSPVQRQEEFKEEFLTCAICSEPYNNDQCQAKCLPCLHTYCRLCLQVYSSGQKEFNCPKCRSLVTLPGGTVDGLPNNFIIDNLKDYRDIFNLAVSCGSCEDEGNQAVSFCHDCGCFICQTCADAHRRMGPLRGHKLSTMSELQQQKYNPMSQRHQQCKKHTTQHLTLFCRKSTCKIPVCASCGLADHQGHDLVDLVAAIDEVAADIQCLSMRVVGKRQDIVTERAAAETIQKTLSESFKQKEKDMIASKQKLFTLINSQYSKAHSHLKSLSETEMSRLTSRIQYMDTILAQMTDACEFANQACETRNPTQFLLSQNQIMSRLRELATENVTEIASERTHLTLTEQHSIAIAHIEASVPNLFGNDWEKRPQNQEVEALVRLDDATTKATAEEEEEAVALAEAAEAAAAAEAAEVATAAEVAEAIAAAETAEAAQIAELVTASDVIAVVEAAEAAESNAAARTVDTTEVVDAAEAARIITETAAAYPRVSSVPQIDPSQCKIRFLGFTDAIVQSVDTTGWLMVTGGARVEASQQGTFGSLDVKDNKNGTYTFSYGRYGGPIHVKINGIVMNGSPFNPPD